MGTESTARQGAVTQRFSRQHAELIDLAKELLKQLDTRTLARDARPARRALAAFSGRLRVHAAMEQDALYPRLLSSTDQQVAGKAQALLAEVGDIYQSFFEHLARFPDAPSIEREPEHFSRETMQFLHRLRLRMKRENDELYPLVEALFDQAGTSRPRATANDE